MNPCFREVKCDKTLGWNITRTEFLRLVALIPLITVQRRLFCPFTRLHAPCNAKKIKFLRPSDQWNLTCPFQIEGLQSIIGGSNGPKSKLFSFNVVFEPASTQADIFQYSGIKKLIEMAAEGFNTTCFCYGQTGSGKTHTLTGPPGMVSDLRIRIV